MSGTIWLITEGETDYDVVRALIKAKGMSVRVEWLKPDHKPGGISRLPDQLEDHIRVARRRRKRNDCIAVLHDWDIHKQTVRQDYDEIKRICSRYDDVVEVIAKGAIESWLLADPGLCAWVGVKPKSWDNEPEPKHELNRLLKKAGKREFKGSGIAEVLKHVSGTGIDSQSMREALAHLENAPCVK